MPERPQAEQERRAEYERRAMLEMVERRRRELQRNRYFAVTSMLLASGFAIIGFIYTSTKERAARLALVQSALPAEFAPRTREQLEQLTRDIADLRKTVSALSSVPESAQISATLTRLTDESTRASTRVKALEDVILEAPDKAIAMPLLRKDLDTQRNTTVTELTAIRAEIARIYDFNKWFFGLIATMALSTLGFAASTLLKRKQPDDEVA